LFKRFSIEGEFFGGLPPGQVATVKSVVGLAPGKPAAEEENQVRTAGDGKPVRVFLAAAERNVMGCRIN